MGAVQDLQTRFQNQSLMDGSTGWTSVRRRIHDDAGDQIVVLTEDGGPTPEVSRASGMGDKALKSPAVQVLVRGNPWDGDGSESKAQALYDDVHGLNSTAINGTTYLSVRARTPHPIFAGYDDNGRPQHTISFVMTTDE